MCDAQCPRLIWRTLRAVSRGPFGWISSAGRFVWDVGKRWYYGRIGDLAASVTFWLIISLPATVLALLAALGPIDRLFGFVTQRLSADDVELQSRIEGEVTLFIERVLTDESGEIQATVASLFERSSPGLLTVSVAIMFWSISRGFAGLIRALEDIYDVAADERRPWYVTRVVAVILGIGSVLVPIPLIVLDQFLWQPLGDAAFIDTLRLLMAVAVLILWASVVYHFGPGTRNSWAYDLPGAVVAALLWWVLTLGFSRYVDLTQRAEGANEIRAAVGAGLLALTWMWLAAQVLLIGGAVNYLFGERLGISRDRRDWSLSDVVNRSTGEIKRIMSTEADPSQPVSGTAANAASGTASVASSGTASGKGVSSAEPGFPVTNGALTRRQRKTASGR